MNPPEALLDLRQARTRLGISEATIKRMLSRNELPVIKLGRLIRIRPEALERYITDREQPAGAVGDGS